MLIGYKFQHYINETVKTRQKSEELFKLKSKWKSQPGWHADNGEVSTGIDLSLRHCYLPPAESRICTEFKEVSSETISENKTFRNGYRLNKDGNLIASTL